MEKNFLYNNFMYDLIYKIVYMIYASMLWVIFCIPVITMGASTTALYYVINKVIRNERGTVFKEFWNAFKLNFKQSTIIWLVFLTIFSIGTIDCVVLRSLSLNGKISGLLFWSLIILLIIIVMISNYIFPYIARFKNNTKTIIINSVYIMVANLGYSILYFALLAIAIIAFVLFPPSIVISPASYMLIINKSLERVFRKYMSQEDLIEEEMRNRKYV